MTDKDAIIQDWKAISDDIYNGFNGKPIKIPVINPWGAVLNGLRSLNPFGAIIEKKHKCR